MEGQEGYVRDARSLAYGGARFVQRGLKGKNSGSQAARHEVMSTTTQEHVSGETRFHCDLLLTRAGVRCLKKVESSCDADDANEKFDALKWDEHGKRRVRCQCPSGSESREGIQDDTEE